MEKTLFKRVEQYKDRWSSFDSETGIISLSEKPTARELKEFEVFEDFGEKFLEQISPDVAIVTWKKGSVLFEEGSFIDVAFYLVEGEVTVHLSQARDHDAGIEPIFASDRTLMLKRPLPLPAAASPSSGETQHYSQTQKLRTDPTATFLSTLDFDLPRGAELPLVPGEFFGEIGALNGWPMPVTASTLTDCVVVQIRVPALRRMKKQSDAFKQRIDRIYRQRALLNQLKASPLFRACPDSLVTELAGKVELISCEPEEIVVQEGEATEAVYLVRSGFMKLSRLMGQGQRAVSYLSKGMTFGEVELLIEEIDSWRHTVSSVGYSELVKISAQDFSRIVGSQPELEKELWRHAVERIKECGASLRSTQQSEFIDFSLEKGLVEGNSILVIDLNTCTRCDECVRACADTHGGRPRFVREGDKYDNLLITKACYHCQDPVCLIGCPTGAIRRANVGNVVEINEDICIGCSHCANNCPYDAISMHDTGGQWGLDALPKALRGQDRMLASKCDLCYTSKSGPACVSNCPQGCASRVGSTEEFQQLLAKRE